MNSVERNKRRLRGSTPEIPKRNRGNVFAVQTTAAFRVLPEGACIEGASRISFWYLLAEPPDIFCSQASDLVVFSPDFHLP